MLSPLEIRRFFLPFDTDRVNVIDILFGFIDS
jgi:hypothetical protein